MRDAEGEAARCRDGGCIGAGAAGNGCDGPPKSGTCVAAGVMTLRSLGTDVIPGAARRRELVSTVIQDHLSNPGNYPYC